MAYKLRLVALLGGLLAFSVPLVAHHGAASFDTTKRVTVKGTVTEYIWANPHVLIKMDVKDDAGNVRNWVVEVWNPVTQANKGWTKNTFKPGDEISVDVTPAKNNQPLGMIRGNIVINGKPFKELEG
jgi:hypothetical protein